jgi:hypothetical protein
MRLLFFRSLLHRDWSFNPKTVPPRCFRLSIAVFALCFSLSSDLRAQNDRDFELVGLGRVATNGWLTGALLEYDASRVLLPWISVRYGMHNSGCDDECIRNYGVSSLAGMRFRLRPGSSFEPYVTLGLGALFWEDETRDVTGTAQAGLVWIANPRLRARVEFGYEGHGSGFTIGVGTTL